MGLLYDLSKKYRTLSIVGMSKNAGKTTALNYLIEEADDDGISLGVTSTGRDGESTDLVTGTDKPRVYLYEDTIVSVPTQLYHLSEAGLEILRKSNYRTSLGEMLICRVSESGYVQIAGPVATADTKKMCEEMFEMDVDLVIIDGAIDRKSIAAPDTSDGIILSAGAVLSRNLKTVVQETAHIVNIYRTEELQNEHLRDLLKDVIKIDRVTVIDRDSKISTLDINTGLGASKYIDEAIGENTEYVYIPGAFTQSVISHIDPNKLKQITFILKDPTRIFFDSVTWKRLLKKGLTLKVLKNIDVAAVTVNPYSPEGYSFDSITLKKAMEEVITDIPVIDVRM